MSGYFKIEFEIYFALISLTKLVVFAINEIFGFIKLLLLARQDSENHVIFFNNVGKS